MKTFLILLFLLGGFCAGAQDSLLVYQLKGKVSLRINDKSQPLKIGNKFGTRQGRLEIEKGGSVILISSTYQAKEFVKSGAVNDVWKSFPVVNATDVSGKYFSYVWEQFTHKHGSPEADRRKYMSNAGGVARGCPGVDVVHLPDTIFYTGKSLRLRWTSKLPAGRLHFNLQRKGAPADSSLRISADTSVSLQMLQQQVKPGMRWDWSLQIDKQQPCAEGVIVYVSPEQYTATEQALRKDIHLVDPAGAALMLALMLDWAGYLDAAEGYYREAAQLKNRTGS